jgi:FkbM family methyltransferase
MNNIEDILYQTYLEPNSIVYDIGGYIGEMSIKFVNLGARKVFTFEPSTLNFSDLLNNTSGHNNIHCYNIALNDKNYDCNTRFKDCSEFRIHGERNREQPIKYSRLNDFIKIHNIDLPDFIKMDIEGMESIVLNTFDFLFENKRPTIHVEIHASSKNNKDDYQNNPHWKWPEDGGFNFNNLKDYQYSIIDNPHGNILQDADWNPIPNTHKHLVLIPNERLPKL